MAHTRNINDSKHQTELKKHLGDTMNSNNYVALTIKIKWEEIKQKPLIIPEDVTSNDTVSGLSLPLFS